MAAVRDCGFELVDHPPYFSWFGTIWLFSVPQHEKNHSAGKQPTWTNDEVTSTVEDFFKDQNESFYTTGIQALQHWWKKCVDCRGDFMEK